MCLSARCVLVCCCTAGTNAQTHLAGAALPTPVHYHTGSSGPTAPCVLRFTISTLCAVLHRLVPCTALHCVCLAALHLWAVGRGPWNFCNALPNCLGGSGQCNSCNALPHCPGAAGGGTPAMHCHTARGKWAVQLVQCTATLPGCTGQRNSCNALPQCLGQWSSCNALPHRVGAVGGGTPAMPCLTYCVGAVGSATPAMHSHTTWGQWAVELLQCTASPPGGSRRWNSCNAQPHCPGALRNGVPSMHCHTTWGRWAVEILQCTATQPGGGRRCNSCNALPHCLGAVGSGTLAIHCHTARGQWAVQLLQCTHCLTAWGQWAVVVLQCTTALYVGTGEYNSCNAPPQWALELLQCPASLTAWRQWAVQLTQCTATLLGSSGQWKFCNALPHYLGAVGSATPAMHCLTAGGTGKCNLRNALTA